MHEKPIGQVGFGGENTCEHLEMGLLSHSGCDGRLRTNRRYEMTFYLSNCLRL